MNIFDYIRKTRTKEFLFINFATRKIGKLRLACHVK